MPKTSSMDVNINKDSAAIGIIGAGRMGDTTSMQSPVMVLVLLLSMISILRLQKTLEQMRIRR